MPPHQFGPSFCGGAWRGRKIAYRWETSRLTTKGTHHMATEMLLLAEGFTRFTDLGLSPIIAEIGPIALRWYSMAYLVGILMAYYWVGKMIRRPGSPMSQQHADDLIMWSTLGIILGGRLFYILFYEQSLLSFPEAFQLWKGGMSFHGGLTGLVIGLLIYARRHKLNGLRIADYIACVAPFGQMLGRIANFINGELWGRQTDVPWAIIFPGGGEFARHPSQLYAAASEGLIIFVVLQLLFWKTDARYKPGFLLGMGIAMYATARFFGEFFREPDAQLSEFAMSTGLSMGQWLTLPMFLIGLYLVFTAKGRRQRVEPVAGGDSVA